MVPKPALDNSANHFPRTRHLRNSLPQDATTPAQARNALGKIAGLQIMLEFEALMSTTDVQASALLTSSLRVRSALWG